MINTDRFAAEAKFVRLRRYRDADVVMCYVSTKEEADTWWLLKTILQDGKLPAVPRVDGDTMEFYIIESLNELEPGKIAGIFEPASAVQNLSAWRRRADGCSRRAF